MLSRCSLVYLGMPWTSAEAYLLRLQGFGDMTSFYLLLDPLPVGPPTGDPVTVLCYLHIGRSSKRVDRRRIASGTLSCAVVVLLMIVIRITVG